MRDTARPVPQLSAAVWCPAQRWTACAWRLFLFNPVCTALTISGRIGDKNTSGNAHDAPLPCCTVTVGSDAGIARDGRRQMSIEAPSRARSTVASDDATNVCVPRVCLRNISMIVLLIVTHNDPPPMPIPMPPPPRMPMPGNPKRAVPPPGPASNDEC